MSTFIFQDEHENMQEMDILDMNILDETENDNGIPAEDEVDNFPSDVDSLMNDEHDDGAFEQEDEAGDPEVRNYIINLY